MAPAWVVLRLQQRRAGKGQRRHSAAPASYGYGFHRLGYGGSRRSHDDIRCYSHIPAVGGGIKLGSAKIIRSVFANLLGQAFARGKAIAAACLSCLPIHRPRQRFC